MLERAFPTFVPHVSVPSRPRQRPAVWRIKQEAATKGLPSAVPQVMNIQGRQDHAVEGKCNNNGGTKTTISELAGSIRKKKTFGREVSSGNGIK
jgi:hypothetical protein